LHEDLHLNGCGKNVEDTYTNHEEAAEYLLLPDMNGKKFNECFVRRVLR
jgi:hypothetical protein